MKSSKGRFPGSAERQKRVQSSPRFNGRKFMNTAPISTGFKDDVERPSIREFICGGERRVPGGTLPLVDPVPTWKTAPLSGLRVTWLGHSTLVIEIDGARFLTDPVWAQRASPVAFAGPKRFHPPPARLDALPKLDAVVLSHDHYDHLDRVTVRKLAKSGVPFITSLGVGEHLEKWGVPLTQITELDWWESTTVKDVTITAAPAQHFSGRSLKDRNTTLWSSMHFRGPKHSFFFGADTGLTQEYRDIAQKLGPFDMVALEIGAYHPSWGDIHMGPVNAVAARELLGSGTFLPIHWGTFNLALHAWDEPVETVLQLAPQRGVPLMLPRLGQPFENDGNARLDPWWREVTGSESIEQDVDLSEEAGNKPLNWLPD